MAEWIKPWTSIPEVSGSIPCVVVRLFLIKVKQKLLLHFPYSRISGDMVIDFLQCVAILHSGQSRRGNLEKLCRSSIEFY